MIFGAVEAGGTKFVCGVGNAEHGSLETARIETRAIGETVAAVMDFFHGAAERHGVIASLGIGSFGPLDLDPASATYGYITTTPKPGWRGANLPGTLGTALNVPVAIDTDVNAAALAEARVGAGAGKATVAYVTVGTGIGVGLALDQSLRHRGGHAEAGHLRLRPHADQAGFSGICPYHGDCLEGLASGTAIEAFWGSSLRQLPENHPAWEIEGDYLGQLCAALALTIAPDRIVLGGGVMVQTRLFDVVRRWTRERLSGYLQNLDSASAMEALIVAPGCREPSGLTGAYLLAADAAASGLRVGV